MISLDTVSRSEFEARLQEIFALVLSDGKFPLTLAEVRYLGGSAPAAKREPFALTLKADKAIKLPQATYTLENETMGTMELFLVQISPTEIEAVFN